MTYYSIVVPVGAILCSIFAIILIIFNRRRRRMYEKAKRPSSYQLVPPSAVGDYYQSDHYRMNANIPRVDQTQEEQ